MAETAASTAYGPIVLSALEQTLPKAQRIVDDPIAIQMLSSAMKLMVKAANLKPIQKMFFNLFEKNSPGVSSGIVCRKRYIEDKVVEALDSGITSLVMLGAGLDTLAYRIPQLSAIHVYELDLPKNIAYKKNRLEALYGQVPSHVTLVPTNFENQPLENVLRPHGYSFDQKSFFVWEGVTQYLTEPAVRDTFQFLAKTKAGSRLIFTYVLKDFIDGKNTYELDSLYQRFRVKSQIWIFGLHSDEVIAFIGEYSWKVLEQVGAQEFSDRYLKPVGRLESVAEIERAVYAEKVAG